MGKWDPVDIFSAALSFAVVTALLTIVPGMDTALVLRTAVTGGRRQAFATALGISTGTMIWGGAAAAGLAALLTASHLAYTALRIAGAVYLIYLGVSTLWRVRLSRNHQFRYEPPESAATDHGRIRAWARGTTTNLLNPKVGAFYVAMLPQFIPAGAAHLPVGLLLALIHAIQGVLWFTLIIHGTHLARTWLSRPAVTRTTQAVTGLALFGFGLRLALDPDRP